MDVGQIILVSFLGLLGFAGFLLGLKQCLRKNPYGLTPVFNIIGAFVWVDAVIFGLFWSVVCFITLLFGNWLLFLLMLSIFWLVRSIGETIYWFNEQFAATKRNPPATLWHSKIFPGTSAYVASQIFWQCMTVVTSITTLYLLGIWFK